MNKRIPIVDALRGVAIVLMIVFHFCFDLNHFGYIHINIYYGLGWKVFRIFIVSLFLLLVGVSLVLAYQDGIKIHKLLKRITILGISALSISVVTYFVFPNSWIYFGILHFIFFATIAGLPFIKYPKISLLVGITIIILYFLDVLHFKWLFAYLQPILDLPLYKTEDIVRFFPWFGVVLIGIYCAKILNMEFKYTPKFLLFLGRHSLLIYLIHQPILFGLTMFLYNNGTFIGLKA